jgi:hypothetical protein
MRTEEKFWRDRTVATCPRGERDFCLLGSIFWFESSTANCGRLGNKGKRKKEIENVIRPDGYRRTELLGSHPCCAREEDQSPVV